MKKKLTALSGELFNKKSLTLNETINIYGGRSNARTWKPTGTQIVDGSAWDGDDTFPEDG